jgi:choice-of-anchor C domain-containing protein
MMRRSYFVAVFLLLMLLPGQPALAGYNILGNGSFETATVDPGGGELVLPTGSAALLLWGVGPDVYYVGGFWQASQGLRSIGLKNGSIITYFIPVLGTMYQVSFDLAGDPTLPPAIKSLELFAPTGSSFSGLTFFQTKNFSFDTTAQTVTNMGWTTEQWNFWGGLDNSRLSFVQFLSNNGNSQGGPALDNVVLVPVSAILQNGSFETVDGSLISLSAITVPMGSTAIYGWLVGGNGIQLMNTTGVWDASQGGVYSLKLNSPTGPGSILQDIFTLPGDLYQVSFDLAGDPTGGPAVKTLRVSAAGQSQDFTFDTTGKAARNMGWVTNNWTFRANSTITPLVFQSLDNGANGPALDNVKVIHPANLVLNGSFEQGPAVGSFTTLSYGDGSISGWTVAGNGIDYIGTDWTASNGGRSLDLNSTDAGSIEQTFLTTPGATYNVSFDLAGNPFQPPTVKTLRVSAGGRSQVFTFDTTGKSPTNMGWISQHFTFKAKWETTTLLFESTTLGTPAGPALDNVRVTQVPVLTPQYLLLLLSD